MSVMVEWLAPRCTTPSLQRKIMQVYNSKESVGFFLMEMGIIPISINVHSHSFLFPFPSWSLIPTPMEFPWDSQCGKIVR